MEKPAGTTMAGKPERLKIGFRDVAPRQTRSSRSLSAELLPLMSGPAREPMPFSGRGQDGTETGQPYPRRRL